MSEPRAQRARIVAVASGKGGTGKSLVAANLGVFLATLGKRVVLVDAAFGGANLHSFVGVPEPRRTLADILARREGGLDEVTETTSITGLELVAGERDPAWMASLQKAQVRHLIEGARSAKTDYVLLDLGAGTSEHVLDLWLSADDRLLVAVPEPTSFELAYRVVKTAFLRRLKQAGLGHLAKVGVDRSREFEGGVQAPGDVLARAMARAEDVTGGDQEVARVTAEMRALRPLLVLNQARSKSDADLGLAMASAASRRFGLVVRSLGHVEYDDAVWVSLRRRRPLLVEHPESRASKCLEKVTRRMLSNVGREPREPELPGDSHYQLIDVEPTASAEAIRRANRRIRQVYSRDSIVVAGLYNRERLEGLQRRLEEAYETLMDPARRKSYDQALFPDGVPGGAVELVVGPDPTLQTEDRPPMPELSEETIFTGPLMQRVREARGLGLREISERTKVGMTYLAAIESESFAKLPAQVYVRGFLMEYARMLNLDVGRVVDTYLERFAAARAQAKVDE